MALDKYNYQAWQLGQVITPEKLNQIENQLVTLTDQSINQSTMLQLHRERMEDLTAENLINGDLNNLKTVGSYSIKKGTIAEEILHTPDDKLPYVLYVIKIGDHKNFYIQLGITYQGTIWIRHTDNTGTWQTWKKISNNQDIEALSTTIQTITSQAKSVDVNTNLNNLIQGGTYAITQNVINGGSNIPFNVPGMLVVFKITRANGFDIHQIYITDGNIWKRSQINSNNGTWSEWVSTIPSIEIPVQEHYTLVTPQFANVKWSWQNNSLSQGSNASTASFVTKLNHGSIIKIQKEKFDSTFSFGYVITNNNYIPLIPERTFQYLDKNQIIVDASQLETDEYKVIIQCRNGNSTPLRTFDVNKYITILNRDKVVDLFIFAGQSNMSGRANVSSDNYPKLIDGAGLEYRAISADNKLFKIAEPFGQNQNNGNSTTANDKIYDGPAKTGGMVTSFVNAYYEKTGVPIVGISASQGGLSLPEFEGTVNDVTYSRISNDIIVRYNKAETYLTNNHYVIRHKFLVWLQGESDVAKYDPANNFNYQDYFNSTIWPIFKTAGVEKCFFIRIGEYESVNNPQYNDYASIIMQQQTKLTQTNPDIIMVSTLLASYKSKRMMQTEWHYTMEAYNEFGTDAGINAAYYVNTGKKPTMYDPKYYNLYPQYYNISQDISHLNEILCGSVETSYPFKTPTQLGRRGTGVYFNCNSAAVYLDGAGIRYVTTDIIPCEAGDVFKISACAKDQANSCPLGVFKQINGVLDKNSIRRPGTKTSLTGNYTGNLIYLKDYIYEVPNEYNCIVVNHLNTTENFKPYVVKLSKNTGLQDNVNLMKTDVEDLKSQIYVPEWIVPQHIYGVVGHPFSLYYYNTLLLDSLDGYHVRVNTDTNVHPTETDRINFLCDTSIRSKSVWLRLHKDTQQNKITEKKITLHVVSEKPASSDRTPINAIFIGDSFTEQRRYLAELQNLAENGSSIALTLYGTRGSTTTSTLDSEGNGRTPKHEGRSGWTVKDYLHTWLHWYKKTDNAYEAYENDFYTPDSVTGKDWNILKDYSDKYDELRQQNRSNHTDVEDTNNVHFDFSGYIARQGYNNITDVFIYLGTNDAASGYPATQDSSIAEEDRNNFIEDYEKIINSIQAYNDNPNNNNKVRIHCMAPLTVRGLTGGTEIGRQRTLEYTKALIDKWDNKVEGIYFVPTHINFNKEYDFKTSLVRATYRNPTKRLVYYDGIHPNEYGYYSIADIIYSHILYYCVP